MTAKFGRFDRDQMVCKAWNIYYLILYEKLPTPGLDQHFAIEI